MRKGKNTIVYILMASSIVLLLVLQVFWLRSSYEDAADNFRKETNALFRTTLFAMQDSLIQRSIEPIAGDSGGFRAKSKRLIIRDSLRIKRAHGHPDSLITYFNKKEKGERVEVFISSEHGDSIGPILRPLMNRIQREKHPGSFIIKLGGDSLKIDSIRKEFGKTLNNAGIDVTFAVIAMRSRERMEHPPARPSGKFMSEVVRVSPASRYAVSFSNIEGLLIREITPQILFSFFLTLLTIGSFYVMYRNMRAQQKLMALKDDFISNVTHELKTPVATVSVALEALKNFNVLDNPQRASEYLNMAQNELNRLTLMTDKILKTAVFEDKGVTFSIEKIDLDALVQQVLSSMQLVFEKRRTRLDYDKEGTDFTLEGSHTHLTNILYNLIDNALKYSAEASPISIRLTDKETKIILSVKDSGIGIPAEYKKKIFEKFFRVPSGDVHNTKGYGLGLSYVAGVIKNHGGDITVESEPEQGSCFTIVLPKKITR